jgi:CheY-like chemotaxis protein
MNLAVNARDAMPHGGVLTMTTRNVHLDELAVRSRVALGPGRYLELTVSDNGSGMTPDVQERAFDPFFSTKPQGKGTGFGLATVYGIARQMGGEASIYSEVGVGTSLHLHLPAADAAAPADVPAPLATPVAKVVAGQRILLVEDEGLLREALDRTLSGAGYVVESATTGEEALALLHEPPDLLVSDVTLPAMGGPELALRLRMLAPGLPVLLMSGYAAHQLPPELAGSVLLMDKPFPARELLARVAEMLAYERSP